MSKNNWPEPSMMLATGEWAKMKSFTMMPINNDCPFIECLYNPMAKTLAIIGKTKKDTFHMIPRLDDNGKPSTIKNQPNETKQQRVSQESYSEYYLTDRTEVENFIKSFAVNHEEFDYKKSLDMDTMDDATAVAPGPQLILEK
jgi:hypothetical protein